MTMIFDIIIWVYIISFIMFILAYMLLLNRTRLLTGISIIDIIRTSKIDKTWILLLSPPIAIINAVVITWDSVKISDQEFLDKYSMK